MNFQLAFSCGATAWSAIYKAYLGYGILSMDITTAYILARYKDAYGREDEARDSGTLFYVIWGFPLGIMSGLSGIGGGVLMVPVTVVVMGFSMNQAVGTSSARIAFKRLFMAGASYIASIYQP